MTSFYLAGVLNVGVELDGKVQECCLCKINSCHLGRQLPCLSISKEQNQPNGEEEGSVVACLCHSTTLPHVHFLPW